MKILSCSMLLLTFLIAGCKKDNGENPAPELSFPLSMTTTVMTYNVAGLPQLISSGNPVNNTSEIGRRINAYNIVQVQEDFNYNHFLYGTAKHPFRTNPSPPVPLGDGMNTLSNYPISNFRRFKWADCNGTDCLTPKGFTYSRIEVLPGITVDFYNLHANAGGAAADLEARRRNIAQICAYIDNQSVGRPVVVMGDFNCRYTREADDIRFFLDRGFTDVWIELIRGGDVPEKGAPSLTNCGPSATAPDCETVDKIFYRSSDQVVITALEFAKPREEFMRDGEELSDHIPVYARLKFEALFP